MAKLSALKVCLKLDIATTTLSNWYKWEREYRTPEHDYLPTLPKYQQASENAPRYWEEEDITVLLEFKEKLPKGRGGVMGTFNARFWGERGKKLLEKRKEQQSL